MFTFLFKHRGREHSEYTDMPPPPAVPVAQLFHQVLSSPPLCSVPNGLAWGIPIVYATHRQRFVMLEHCPNLADLIP